MLKLNAWLLNSLYNMYSIEIGTYTVHINITDSTNIAESVFTTILRKKITIVSRNLNIYIWDTSIITISTRLVFGLLKTYE